VYSRSVIVVFILHILGLHSDSMLCSSSLFIYKPCLFGIGFCLAYFVDRAMNGFLTKQGGVAKILTFVCGRCLGLASSRTLAVLT
jgi:hypothetical protein